MKEYVQQFLKSTIYIFGITRNGLLLAYYLKANTQTMLYFVDNDVHKQKQPRFMKIPCVSVGEIDQNERIIISTNTKKNSSEIYHQLIQLGCNDIVYLNHTVIEKYAMSMNDAEYLKCIWYYKMGYELDLDCPKTFNEKLQWLKLHDRNMEYTKLVDKYEVKEYIARIIGEEYVIPTIGIWDSFDDINFDELPEAFVLKCTHDSGSVIVCKDKTAFEWHDVRDKLNESLSNNFFYLHREWPYRNVQPRLMVEKFMKNKGRECLIVYKFMCFNGKPKVIQVIQDDKQQNESIDYFDTNWNLLELKQNFPNSRFHLPPPKTLSTMIKLAKIISKNMRFLRVDFYEIEGKPYFSECTFYSDAGFAEFYPDTWDMKLGEWIHL